MKRFHFPTKCVLHQPGSPRPAECIAWGSGNAARCAQQGLAWLHGVRKLPRGRESCPEPEPIPASLSCPAPCVPSGARVCVPPLPPALPPPSLSPCKAEHWDGQNSLVRTPGTGWGSRQHPRSSCLQHLLWSQGCQGCVWAAEQRSGVPLEVLLGLTWVCPGEGTSGGTFAFSCWVAVVAGAVPPPCQGDVAPLSLLWQDTLGQGWGDPRDRVVAAAGQATGRVSAHPRAGSWSCCPHSSSIRTFPKAWRGIPVPSLAGAVLLMLPLMLPRRPSVRPLSTLSIHPPSARLELVSPVAASTPPRARSLAPPSIPP